MRLSQKEKHIDRIVGLIMADDPRAAHRYYVENRVSYVTYAEAQKKAARALWWFAAKEKANANET